MEKAKIQKSKWDILGDFQTMCTSDIWDGSGGERSGFYLILLLYSVGCSSSIIKDQKKNFCRFGQFVVGILDVAETRRRNLWWLQKGKGAEVVLEWDWPVSKGDQGLDEKETESAVNKVTLSKPILRQIL